jgi:hypothetical protein
MVPKKIKKFIIIPKPIKNVAATILQSILLGSEARGWNMYIVYLEACCISASPQPTDPSIRPSAAGRTMPLFCSTKVSRTRTLILFSQSKKFSKHRQSARTMRAAQLLRGRTDASALAMKIYRPTSPVYTQRKSLINCLEKPKMHRS